MGKCKKKKQKVADFQKVKLKVGKRKPLGTNVTDTSFRTSTINFSTQFESGTEPVNRKKLSLKELLNQLNHYNINVRHEALSGLRDLFQTHPNVMREQLNLWISKVFIKITDVDPGVRHALNLCLTHAFSNLLEMEVSPFFKVIIASVCCGLTHINEGVQLDSLDILGIILDKYPQSFIPHSTKVLENIIDLISKETSKETTAGQTVKGSKVAKGVSAIVSRQLSLNADGRMSTFKSRTRILEKLYAIIKVFRQPHKVLDKDDKQMSSDVIHVSDEKQTFVKMYKYSLKPAPVKNIELEYWLKMDEHNRIINDAGNMQSLILKIFPLILNIWVEYEPAKLSTSLNDSPHCLRPLLPGMKVIIDILDILLDPLQSNDKTFHSNVSLLYKSFSKEIVAYFLSSFILPIHFSKSTSSKSIKSGNPDAFQQFAIEFNFLMAKLICSLLRQHSDGVNLIVDSKQRLAFFTQLTSFITLVIDSNNLIVDSKKLVQFFIIIDDLLHLKRSGDKRETDVIDVDVIFKILLDVYKVASLSSIWKIPLICFFSKYISEHRYIFVLKDNIALQHTKGFTESLITNIWSLPSSSESLIRQSVKFIKLILVRKLADEDIMSKMSSALIEMTTPSGLFNNLNEDLQRWLIEIVYYIGIPPELLKNLALLCHLDNISLSVKKYLISVITYCALWKEKTLELERYLSFLFTVVVGFSVDDLQKFNAEISNSVSWSILNIYPNKAKEIPVDYAISQLEQLNGLNHVLSMLVPVVGGFLIQLRKLPVTAALGLLKLIEKFSTWQECQYGIGGLQSVDSEINQIADLLSAILLYSLSQTYKQVTKVSNCCADEQIDVEEELKRLSINLLMCNQVLLRLLIKKWINVLGEYKMNACCVNSIIEVLIVLLEDPKLLPILSEMKVNFQSIVNAFYPICMPHVQQSLIEQLKMQVMLL